MRFMGFCCDRPDHVLLRIIEQLWNLGLEKLLSVQKLISCCGSLEINIESNVDNGGLACEVLEGNLSDSSKTVMSICYFKLRNVDLVICGKESTTINKRPEPLK